MAILKVIHCSYYLRYLWKALCHRHSICRGKTVINLPNPLIAMLRIQKPLGLVSSPLEAANHGCITLERNVT